MIIESVQHCIHELIVHFGLSLGLKASEGPIDAVPSTVCSHVCSPVWIQGISDKFLLVIPSWWYTEPRSNIPHHQELLMEFILQYLYTSCFEKIQE